MPTARDANRLVQELEAHPACSPALLARVPVTDAVLSAMAPSEREAQSRAQIEAVQQTPGWQRARDVLRALGQARYAPSVELLARLWRYSLITPLRIAAGHALFDIGTPEAHEALQAALEDADPHGHFPSFLAIKSMVATQPFTAFDRLAPFLERRHHAVVYTALRFLGPSTLGTPKTWHLPVVPKLLRSDRRWVRAALGLRRDAEFGVVARLALRSLTNQEVEAALREYPDSPPAPVRRYDGPRDLAARYARGEHDAVWNWLRGTGVLRDAKLEAEAESVAMLTMERVRRNVERVHDRLASGRYPFDHFLPSWAPPKATVAEDIGRIETAVGGRVPLSLRAFWSVVGEVYWKFSEKADSSEWRGLSLAEADPLCLLSPSDAWFAIDEWQQERELAHPEIVGPATLQLAPDYLRKANISGGAAYGFTIPSDSVDSVFENEAHSLPFVDYLRLCFRWGGFPRLERERLTTEGSRTLKELTDGLEPF